MLLVGLGRDLDLWRAGWMARLRTGSHSLLLDLLIPATNSQSRGDNPVRQPKGKGNDIHDEAKQPPKSILKTQELGRPEVGRPARDANIRIRELRTLRCGKPDVGTPRNREVRTLLFRYLGPSTRAYSAECLSLHESWPDPLER